jgi:predicted nucleotidyltransferase
MDALPPVIASVTPDALGELCQRCHVRRLDLFGSAADGRFDPARSDLDFLVTFEDDRERSRADDYFGLRDGLMDLFGRDVDLVVEQSVRNPWFLRKAGAQRIRLFPAT